METRLVCDGSFLKSNIQFNPRMDTEIVHCPRNFKFLRLVHHDEVFTSIAALIFSREVMHRQIPLSHREKKLLIYPIPVDNHTKLSVHTHLCKAKRDFTRDFRIQFRGFISIDFRSNLT